MYRQYSFLLVFPLLFTVIALHLIEGGDQPAGAPVNAVIGDESYIQTYGEEPGDEVPDSIRIRTHLEYVEGVLRNRPVDDLTDEQKKNRETYLDLLVDYTLAGEFPRNDGHPDDRRPVFISEDGHICAVGYLVEQTVGHEVAEKVNEEFKYSYIPDIDHPVFLEWAEQSGFTMKELAMIQPAYQPVIVEEKKQNKNKIHRTYGVGFSLLTATNALYLSNHSATPWMFSNSSSSHWFGLAAGTGSILLGVLNLGRTGTYYESLNPDMEFNPGTGQCLMGCPLREVTETNHIRTGMAAANIGMGLVSVARAGFHLVNGTEPQEQESSGLGITQLVAEPIHSAEVVPALTYTVRF